MTEKVRIAGVQMNPRISEKAANLDACLERIQEATKLGAKLIVFPECCLTGYCFSSLDEAVPITEAIPGPSTKKVASACRKLAFENKVHYIAVDRVGEERGVSFIGRSKIVDVQGTTVAEAGSSDEEIIYADIDLEEARQKRTVLVPGEFEYDLIRDRSDSIGEFYGRITKA